MRNSIVSIVGVLATVILVGTARGEEIAIVISPSTLNLDSAGEWVTVHAEIPFSVVDDASVELNGIPVEATFADNRGELVAKFLIGDVKEIVEPGLVTLTLAGTTIDGGPFSGTDTIRVIQSRGK